MSLFDCPNFSSHPDDIEKTQRNYYECSCGYKWSDEWDCACDDDCPECGDTCSSSKSEDIEG